MILMTLNNDPDVTFWPYFFGRIIGMSYVFLCVLSAVQLLRTICHRHKIKSFRFTFLLLCFLWTFIRVIFWFVVVLHQWPVWLSTVIYFFPSCCQIATFSLLILFYAKLVHLHRWRERRVCYTSFCLVANFLMMALIVALAMAFDRTSPKNESYAVLGKIYYFTSSLFFGTLVVMAAYYVHQLHKTKNSTGNASSLVHLDPTYTSGTTSKREVLVTSLVFLIFASRCICDLMAAFGSDMWRHHIIETVESHTKLLQGSTLALIFLWEIVPTLTIIIYFRRIPATGISLCGRLMRSYACIRMAHTCCCGVLFSPQTQEWFGCYDNEDSSRSPSPYHEEDRDEDEAFVDDAHQYMYNSSYLDVEPDLFHQPYLAQMIPGVSHLPPQSFDTSYYQNNTLNPYSSNGHYANHNHNHPHNQNQNQYNHQSYNGPADQYGFDYSHSTHNQHQHNMYQHSHDTHDEMMYTGQQPHQQYSNFNHNNQRSPQNHHHNQYTQGMNISNVSRNHNPNDHVFTDPKRYDSDGWKK